MPMFWPRLWHNVMAIAPTFPYWNKSTEKSPKGEISSVNWHISTVIKIPFDPWKSCNYFGFSPPHWCLLPWWASTPLLCMLSHCGYCEMFVPWGAHDVQNQLASKIDHTVSHDSTGNGLILTVPLREKMDDVTLLPDVVLPVFHEVLQRYQWIFHDWHHIFRGPGLHGNQHDPGVQLFLVDLGT